jgi:hypothetical protein
MGRRAKDDDRTPMQRRAAAIGELARRRLDARDLPERGGEKPHLALVASVETLRLEPGSPMAQLDRGRVRHEAPINRVEMKGSTVGLSQQADEAEQPEPGGAGEGGKQL